jgi:Uncharacterised protein family (UPF0158)
MAITLHTFVTTRFDTRRWPESIPVAGRVSSKTTTASRRTSSIAGGRAFAPAVLAVERGNYPGLVLDLSSLDVEEIGNALAGQAGCEHRWLINPQTGEIAFWTAGTGIDGQAPVDLDELDLVCIDPLPSWVWYQDMADFAETITGERAGRRLARAIQGKGAFRRFRDELRAEYPDLLPAWCAFRDVRARRRAVQWLAGNSLIDDDAAGRFLAGHPDPDLP